MIPFLGMIDEQHRSGLSGTGRKSEPPLNSPTVNP